MPRFKPARLLIYRIGQLGDTIAALPALWVIREHFPSAYLAMLSDHNESHISAANVLPRQGLIDRHIFYEAESRGASFARLLRLIPRLRRERFDSLAYLAPRFRSRRQVLRDLLFFRAAGISQFFGHRGIKPAPKRAPGEAPPHLEPEADHLLSRLALSGILGPPPGQGCMDLGLEAAEVAAAEAWLRRRAGVASHPLLIGLGVGSKYPAKVWPEERYASLGHCLIDRLGGFPIIFGGPEDREKGQRLLSQWPRGANAAGELNVRQAAAALSFCRLFIGNDTGTMHLAAAVGTQCIAIFSARYFPGCWHPYGSQHIVLRRRVPCEGCTVVECKEYEQACLRKIGVADVLTACHQALAKEPTQGSEAKRDNI